MFLQLFFHWRCNFLLKLLVRLPLDEIISAQSTWSGHTNSHKIIKLLKIFAQWLYLHLFRPPTIIESVMFCRCSLLPPGLWSPRRQSAPPPSKVDPISESGLRTGTKKLTQTFLTSPKFYRGMQNLLSIFDIGRRWVNLVSNGATTATYLKFKTILLTNDD